MAQFRKRGGKTMEQRLYERKQSVCNGRGTAMAVCLEQRSGKSALTAVYAEDGGA